MKRTKVKTTKTNKGYFKNIWEIGDIAYVQGKTKIEIVGKDRGQTKLKVKYLEETMNGYKVGNEIGHIRFLSRRVIYPKGLRRKEIQK